MPIKIFISYSHKDEKYLADDSLRGYLKGLEAEDVEFWWDRKITTASLWDDEIKDRIQETDLALVLVSQAFLNSEYIRNEEIELFLEASTRRGLIIFPVILSPCEWQRHQWLHSRQFLPRDGKTIEVDYQEEGPRKALFLQILEDLRIQIQVAKKRKAPRLSRRWFALYARHYARHMWQGLLLTSALLLAIFVTEKTAPVHALKLKAYETLQYPLFLLRSEENVPVVVLDIQNLKPPGNGPTPRSIIQTLISKVVQMNPAAIGIDINMAPSPTDIAMNLDDPQFFDFCLNRNETRGVPIILGTSGTEPFGPQYWLGNSKYKNLAGSLTIPNEDLSRMPRWFWTKDMQSGERCPTIGLALAQAAGKLNERPAWLRSSVEQFFIPHDFAGIKREEFLMDYSHLEIIMKSTLPIASPDAVGGDSWQRTLEGKIVLIGDAVIDGEKPNAVPGRQTNVAGVFIHAAAVDTLVRGPLYVLKYPIRILLALLLAIFLLALRVRINNRFPFVNEQKLRYQTTLKVGMIAITAVILVGVLLIVSMRIVWLDFLFVGVTLGLYFLLDRGKRARTTA